MLYKVTGNLHLWGWSDFKKEINGRLIDHETSGNRIISIIYQVEQPINNKILRKYKLRAEPLKEFLKEDSKKEELQSLSNKILFEKELIKEKDIVFDKLECYKTNKTYTCIRKVYVSLNKAIGIYVFTKSTSDKDKAQQHYKKFFIEKNDLLEVASKINIK